MARPFIDLLISQYIYIHITGSLSYVETSIEYHLTILMKYLLSCRGGGGGVGTPFSCLQC